MAQSIDSLSLDVACVKRSNGNCIKLLVGIKPHDQDRFDLDCRHHFLGVIIGRVWLYQIDQTHMKTKSGATAKFVAIKRPSNMFAY